MGLRIGGISVQLLGNKSEEHNSVRQESGLGKSDGERQTGKSCSRVNGFHHLLQALINAE